MIVLAYNGYFLTGSVTWLGGKALLEQSVFCRNKQVEPIPIQVYDWF